METAEETEAETEEETEAEMEAATEAASAAAEPEAATETEAEAEAAMSLSPNANPALATGRRTAKMSRTKKCQRTPQPSSAAGESEGIVPEPRRLSLPAHTRDAVNPESTTSLDGQTAIPTIKRSADLAPPDELYSNHHHSHRSPTLGVSKGQ